MICTNREEFLKNKIIETLKEFGADEFFAHCPSFSCSPIIINEHIHFTFYPFIISESVQTHVLPIHIKADANEWDNEKFFSDQGLRRYEELILDLEKEFCRRRNKFVKGYKKFRKKIAKISADQHKEREVVI